MTDLASPDHIETIVGAPRHATEHVGRAVTASETVFVLHSRACVDREPDLRDCPFSIALDRGIDPACWPLDTPVRLSIVDGRLQSEERP